MKFYTQQAFIAQGKRIVSSRAGALQTTLEGHRQELQNNLDVWLTLMGPLSHWRVAPEIETNIDFLWDHHVTALHARGWVAKAVLLAEHKTWRVEL